MAWYVHISTCFSAEYNPVTAEIAKNHLQQCEGEREIQWMLKAFSEGEGFFTGPRGDLFNWGIVGNHTNGLEFARKLIPFLEDLRKTDGSSFLDFDHALVFLEEEQSQSTTVYEIKPAYDNEENPLVIVEHPDMPFCWNQF